MEDKGMKVKRLLSTIPRGTAWKIQMHHPKRTEEIKSRTSSTIGATIIWTVRWWGRGVGQPATLFMTHNKWVLIMIIIKGTQSK